jgi:hypothetical protein
LGDTTVKQTHTGEATPNQTKTHTGDAAHTTHTGDATHTTHTGDATHTTPKTVKINALTKTFELASASERPLVLRTSVIVIMTILVLG